MNVISLKDYAAENNISYEAVRQQVVRYKEELEGHIIRDGRQQFLDEEAVAFLDGKRQKNPVAIIQQSKDEAIDRLEDQVKQLLVKVASQAENIAELAQWKADNAMLIAGAEQMKLALTAEAEKATAMERRIAEKETAIAQKEAAIEEAKAIEAMLQQERDDAAARAAEAEKALQAEKDAKEEAESLLKILREENELLRKRTWYQLLLKPFRKGKTL